MSSIVSPGRGQSTWTQTIDGRFCGKIRSEATTDSDGATNIGSVIDIPTPDLRYENNTKLLNQGKKKTV